jgi:ParB family transcriptional regulator, chromosome partitioning protein
MADKKPKTRGLGRGLSALMADVTAVPADAGPASGARSDIVVPIERISANPEQPRRRFDQAELDDLAASIREKGVIQPLIVRERDPGNYEIVAGERRWRAAQQAQLHELPVLVRDYDDTEVLEVAIIENIQRADLNAIEEAAGYRQLMDRFGHTQEKLAGALGKSRSHIANLMRLLSLPEDVLELVRDGKLSGGHARALITAEDPSNLARKVVKDGISVRGVESLVRRMAQAGQADAKTGKPKPTKDADTQALENDLSANLRMRVTLRHRPGQEAGTMAISYNDLDQLDTLCRLLSGN